MNSHNLILASASKVRAQMLSNAGLSFSVEVSSVDEDAIKNPAGDKSVEHIAEELAITKAQKVSANRSDSLVIGTDQTRGARQRVHPFAKFKRQIAPADHRRCRGSRWSSAMAGNG